MTALLRRLLPVLALSVAGTAAATVAAAQPTAGLGEDAIPVPARGMRLVIGAHWDEWDRRLLPNGTRAPLLAGLSTPAFGATHLPVLDGAQEGIRQLLGASDFTLSLGPLDARGAVRRATTTLNADFGITRRIGLGVRISYVEVVHDAQLVLNRAGVDANVGANPNQITNASVYVQLGTARNQLLDAITACGTDGAGDLCEAILADPAAAQALAARAEAFRNAWGAVYGSENAGSPVVPIHGSETHDAISAALEAIREDFTRYFPTSIPANAPLGAVRVYGSNGLQELAQDSAFGVNADTLGGGFRAGMGDVDVEARVLLFDTWRGDQVARLNTTRSGVRLMASAGWRFGAASSAQANEPFALALGDGVNAVLLRATADAVWKRRAWISATIRTTTPIADEAVVRMPGAGLPEFFFLGRPQAVTRTLGRRTDFEVAPRIALGEKFGVSASWLTRSFSGDRYEPLGDGTPFVTPSGSAQYGAVAVSYSTLAAFTRGRSKRAVEVMYAHEVALSTSGLSVPSLARDRLELRIYTGFPRR